MSNKSGWYFERYECFVATKPLENHVPLYRAWDGHDHLYTTSLDEYNGLPRKYQREGIACYVSTTAAEGHIPLYRFYNPQDDDHLYTASRVEKSNLTRANRINKWQLEKIEGYVLPPLRQDQNPPNDQTTPVDHAPLYRVYNPVVFDHFYTTDLVEAIGGVAPIVSEKPDLIVRTMNTHRNEVKYPLRLKGIAQEFHKDWPEQIGLIGLQEVAGQMPGNIDDEIQELTLGPYWTTVSFFKAGGNTYLLLLKQSSGEIHIHQMNTNGTIGSRRYTGDWSSGWTHAEPFVVEGHPFLFLLKQANGIVHIHDLLPNGSVGDKIQEHDWTSGWTTVSFFYGSGNTYLFLLKKENGLVHIHQMNRDGTVGVQVDNRNWSSGWTDAKPFSVNGKSFLLLLKQSTGETHIHLLLPNGKIGNEIQRQSWWPWWTSVLFFNIIGGKTYLFRLSKYMGFVIVNEMNDDGTIGVKTDQRVMMFGWTHANKFIEKTNTYLFLLKEKGSGLGRINLLQKNGCTSGNDQVDGARCLASELGKQYAGHATGLYSTGNQVGLVIDGYWKIIDNHWWELGAYQKRYLFEVLLEHRKIGCRFRFYSTHLSDGDSEDQKNKRIKQVGIIVDKVLDRARPDELPPIVVGDFNASRDFRTSDVDGTQASVKIMERVFWRPIDTLELPYTIEYSFVDNIFIGKKENFPKSQGVFRPVYHGRHLIPMADIQVIVDEQVLNELTDHHSEGFTFMIDYPTSLPPQSKPSRDILWKMWLLDFFD